MSDDGPAIRRRPAAASALTGVHPVVARVLAGRGVDDGAELDRSLAHLPEPALADVEPATARLERALRAGERILVIGDFDADGATSVALAVRALGAFGAARVDYLIPSRFDSGYGLTPELVAEAATRSPALIVTVDNGVTAHAGVAAATERGIDTIVTDHHVPGDALPAAVAVVDPNRADCPFPGHALAGVGVVFYLLAALRRRLAASGWFRGRGIEPPAMARFLDLVAIGTIADLVPLDRINRILVAQGLRRIRARRTCPGIIALLEAARRAPEHVGSGDLGYALGPRLNAAGRLADMALGAETLLAEDPAAARELARRLERLNRERRDIEAEMAAQADAEIERLRTALRPQADLPAGLVLHDPRWHQGVAGILAGRVRESVRRPTVVFADAGAGVLKGSARSVPELHVRDVLAAIDTLVPGLIERFGGHAMAAGLTLPVAHLEPFRATFAAEVERALGGCAPRHELVTDGPLTREELTLDTAEALHAAGPWGPGFPEPLFDGAFEVIAARTVGGRHRKLRVRPAGAGSPVLEAIRFNAAGPRAGVGDRVHLVYRLEVNAFRGRRLQLVVEHVAGRPGKPWCGGNGAQ